MKAFACWMLLGLAAWVAPDLKALERDAAQAIREMEAWERTEALIRETLRGPLRRPDLAYEVWSGIQSRNLGPALRQR
jgi:hypothetical protein